MSTKGLPLPDPDKVIETSEKWLSFYESKSADQEQPWDGFCGLVKVCDSGPFSESGVVQATTKQATADITNTNRANNTTPPDTMANAEHRNFVCCAAPAASEVPVLVPHCAKPSVTSSGATGSWLPPDVMEALSGIQPLDTQVLHRIASHQPASVSTDDIFRDINDMGSGDLLSWVQEYVLGGEDTGCDDTAPVLCNSPRQLAKADARKQQGVCDSYHWTEDLSWVTALPPAPTTTIRNPKK